MRLYLQSFRRIANSIWLSHEAGTENFYAITRYNWSSYYAMAVIELAEAVAREMQGKP